MESLAFVTAGSAAFRLDGSRDELHEAQRIFAQGGGHG